MKKDAKLEPLSKTNVLFVIKSVPDLYAQPLLRMAIPTQVEQQRTQSRGSSIKACRLYRL